MHHSVEQETGGSLAAQQLDANSQTGITQRPDNAGFTLIEMLVVLVLTAVMAAMMVSGIRQMQTWTQLEKRQSAQSTLEAVADHISGELSGALSLPILDWGNDAPTPMIGAANSVRFVAVIRTGFSAKALRETSYTTEPSPAGKSLVRKSRPHRFPQQGQTLQVQSDELQEGVTDLKFGYLTRGGENEMIWLDAWTKQAKLPVAVRITISQTVGRSELSASRTISLIN
jgi:prepilin-type N-terminal cleavage/methylation domain-containing protein